MAGEAYFSNTGYVVYAQSNNKPFHGGTTGTLGYRVKARSSGEAVKKSRKFFDKRFPGGYTILDVKATS